jgi:hypothetical protein
MNNLKSYHSIKVTKLFMITVCIAVFIHCGNSSNKVDGINLINSTSGASPFSIISLGKSSFDDSDIVMVEFSNSSGYSAKVIATSPNPLEVAVPVYINPIDGTLDSGTVSLLIIYPDSTKRAVQGSLKIAALPTLSGFSPGAITEAFFRSVINLIASAKTSLDSVTSSETAAAALVTPTITSYLTTNSAKLTTISAAISAFRAGTTNETVGSISTTNGSFNIKMDTIMMRNSDRIIAAFLEQIALTSLNKKHVSESALSKTTSVDPDFALNWYNSLSSTISDKWLEDGKKLGSAVGTVTTVTGMAVLFAGVAASAPLIATAGAVIGAMGFAASTFSPAASAEFLKMGSTVILGGEASKEDYLPPVKYVAKNTLAKGASYWLTSWVEKESGDISSVVVDLVDDQAGFTAAVSNYVVEGIDFFNSSIVDTNTDTTDTSTETQTTYTASFSGTSKLTESCDQFQMLPTFNIEMIISGDGTTEKPYQGSIKITGALSPLTLVYCNCEDCDGELTDLSTVTFSATGVVSGSHGTVESVASGTLSSGSSIAAVTAVFTGGTLNGDSLTGSYTFSWESNWTAVEKNILLKK